MKVDKWQCIYLEQCVPLRVSAWESTSDLVGEGFVAFIYFGDPPVQFLRWNK